MLKRVLFCLFVLCTQVLQAAPWEKEYWQYFKWNSWESGRCKLYSVCELRFNDNFSHFYHYRLTENFAYQALPYLATEIHYSYIGTIPFNASHFTHLQRLELELNPSMTLCNDIELKWRNRLELIKKQGVKNIEFTFRHRLTVEFPMEGWGCLEKVACSDELFYEFNPHKLSQNRFMPIQATFKLNKHFSLSAFVMLRQFYVFSIEKWVNSLVLGTELNF